MSVHGEVGFDEFDAIGSKNPSPSLSSSYHFLINLQQSKRDSVTKLPSNVICVNRESIYEDILESFNKKKIGWLESYCTLQIKMKLGK